MKKMWRKNDGVSPVIATILMVAITVVLAAVLYVMVIGFRPPINNASAGSWTDVRATSQTSGIAKFGAFTGNIEPISLRVFVMENGTDVGYISWGSNIDPSMVNWNNGPDGATVTYFDYDPSGGQVNAGDYIELSGLLSGTTYSFETYNVATTSILPMTGDNPLFSTP
ncbi:MAG: hypothetical protein AYK23_02220 [Candidatus Proteinoplasmatales archaeon SG8-5]|nr:MAG: hypothetical protein AYK23_02220 [Candidatus Proteinoplasmatales archaeon SG8-5]